MVSKVIRQFRLDMHVWHSELQPLVSHQLQWCIILLHLFDRISCLAWSHRFRYLSQLLGKDLPVLCHLDGGDWSSEDPHIVLPQRPTLLQLHTTVERRLTSKREEDTIRPLALYHLEGGRERERERGSEGLALFFPETIASRTMSIDYIILQDTTH